MVKGFVLSWLSGLLIAFTCQLSDYVLQLIRPVLCLLWSGYGMGVMACNALPALVLGRWGLVVWLCNKKNMNQD